MKTMITLFVALFVGILSVSAQVSDAEFIKNWNFNDPSWNGIRPGGNTVWPTHTAEFIAAVPRLEAKADTIADFDPENANFDAVWASVSGEGYPLNFNNGAAAEHKGDADFKGAYKAFYDDLNIYILLQYTDDVNLGTETVEICWAPYFKLDGSLNTSITTINTSVTPNGNREYAQYGRYEPFGAYKATFTQSQFKEAMIVGPLATDPTKGNIQWSGTSALLSNNLFVSNKTASGSNVVKMIYTIGFPALTGVQRPDFDTNIWRALEGGKGISFDIKVNDLDGDEATAGASAAYWWSSTNNLGYALNYYTGFLGLKVPTSVKNIQDLPSIFGAVTANHIELTSSANIDIYSVTGKSVKSLKNVSRIDLSTLNPGAYIVKANNQVLKVIR